MLALSATGRNPLALLPLLAALALAACDAPVLSGGPAGGGADRAGRPIDVALLVPSGAEGGGAVLAENLENAARLAAADVSGADVSITVYDTAGSGAGAGLAAREAISDGADVIVGPVFAEAAAAAGVAAAPSGTNVLAFSNNPAIAGGNVFILGNTFDTAANRLVGYAVASGRGSIFVVNAADPAEEAGRDAIIRAISRQGARLAGTATFPLSQEGVIAALPGIADEINASGANAVFLTSGVDGALPFIAELLPEYNLDTEAVQVIGLQRLDAASATSLSGLQGAWFALPDRGLTAQFSSRYQAAYGAVPHPIAPLGYDAIAALGALAAAGESPTRAALTQGSGFAGAGGVFRLNPDGTNIRGLAVAEIIDRQVVVIDPAPRSFGGAGL